MLMFHTDLETTFFAVIRSISQESKTMNTEQAILEDDDAYNVD